MNIGTYRNVGCVALAAAISLAACGGNSSRNNSVTPPEVRTDPILVMLNGSTNKGLINRLDSDLNVEARFSSGGNEGMAQDLLGNVYVADDTTTPSSFQTIHLAAQREDSSLTDPALERDIDAPGSATVKGIAVAHEAGLLFAANVGGNSIEVFGTAAGDMAQPLASTALPANCWDLAYNETLDILFLAMTNGTILVVDDYVAGGFDATAARTITPGDGSSISNIHGIAYRAATDTLVVTDVGDAAVADDGKVYVISNASSASGMVTPDRTIAGPATMLGNPVDLILDGDKAYIAEKSNDAILVYNNIFSGASGDVAPNKTVASVKPESLVQIRTPSLGDDVSDIDDSSVTINGVLVSSNAPLPGDPDVVVLDTDLTTVQRDFTVGESLESVSVNQLGDVYLTADDGANLDGRIVVVNRLGTERDGEMFSLSRDRIVSGAATTLVSPKGFDVADEAGLLLITDNGDPAVKVFGAQSGGNAPPLFSTTLTVPPWDLAYDPDQDRLYVALTDGTVAVFDDYVANEGADDADRIITPAIGGSAVAAPTNLHGIVYVADSNALIVSDVGSGANPTDGKLYVIENADRAEGNTNVSVNIDNGDGTTVGNTQLGNPVDIAFDGSSLYVAEKSQDQVLRFDNILSSPGGDVTPDASYAQTKPESVVLLPDYLAPAEEDGLPSGSIR
ncbi:hypothetical protein [Alcanivorax sp.]|uniref:hypothetical protein n=1 Tax=Alcanivorax sp. TaxID=1872427 RepID=UPI0025BB9A38|nr:hypothetical protein [Alcanivorax sp.]